MNCTRSCTGKLGSSQAELFNAIGEFGLPSHSVAVVVQYFFLCYDSPIEAHRYGVQQTSQNETMISSLECIHILTHPSHTLDKVFTHYQLLQRVNTCRIALAQYLTNLAINLVTIVVVSDGPQPLVCSVQAFCPKQLV